MHTHSLDRWQHKHVFLGSRHRQNERKTWFVIGLTATMMIAEILGGILFGSMALTADGWHMLTHVTALGISAFAYSFARKHKDDSNFAFGTGKFGDLAAFTSAVILGMIALLIAYQSIERMVTPISIAFGEALPIACLGLLVNIVSASLLHDHGHHHTHHEKHKHTHHRDNNLRSAYFHVIADAATSVLAIIGLSLGWLYGWLRVDAIIGVIGSGVIASWAFTLIRDAGRVLLDVTPDKDLTKKIRQTLEVNQDLVTDLHLWQVGTGHFGVIVSLVSDNPKAPDFYKKMLADFDTLSHITVEVHPCPEA